VTAASTSLVARRQNVNAGTSQPFGATAWRENSTISLTRYPAPCQRGFEEHQFEQIGIVEVLGIAFEERHRGEFGLLDVQIPGLRKLGDPPDAKNDARKTRANAQNGSNIYAKS